VWTFARPLSVAARAARLIVRTNCPGHVRWRLDAREWLDAPVTPVGGVMAGVSRHELVLGPFPADAQRLQFVFHCEHGRCAGRGPCCELGVREVELA
jgi:hypothetical protein